MACPCVACWHVSTSVALTATANSCIYHYTHAPLVPDLILHQPHPSRMHAIHRAPVVSVLQCVIVLALHTPQRPILFPTAAFESNFLKRFDKKNRNMPRRRLWPRAQGACSTLAGLTGSCPRHFPPFFHDLTTPPPPPPDASTAKAHRKSEQIHINTEMPAGSDAGASGDLQVRAYKKATGAR